MLRNTIAWIACFAFLLPLDTRAEVRVQRNAVYGMYSGLALLMDVHAPEHPNGAGIVFVNGSGWEAALGYDAAALKESRVKAWIDPLTEAGYTVFSINHRAAPRFRHPAAVEDVQRAVRFVRFHAKEFAIDRDRLAGVGGSSGAHLIGLVGLIGASGIADDPDPVNREHTNLRALVLRAAPTDLRKFGTAGGVGHVVSFIGMPPTNAAGAPANQKLYADTSPITHVSRNSPPILLLHGDSDDTVPFEQSVLLEAKLRSEGIPTKLVRVVDGEHGPAFGPLDKPHAQLPQVFSEMVRWLDKYMLTAATASPR